MQLEQHQKTIGFQARALSNLIRRAVDQMILQNGGDVITGVQGWIIGYLYERRQEDIFQRDLEKAFSIRRSTIASTLKLMEKNDLVTRQAVNRDARLKKLDLTPKALAMHTNILSCIEQAEKQASQNISPEELETFHLVVDKMIHNLK